MLRKKRAGASRRRTVNNMRQNIAIALITVSLLLLGVLLGE
jgi:Cd2+/Zn2+-exporting ATPase